MNEQANAILGRLLDLPKEHQDYIWGLAEYYRKFPTFTTLEAFQQAFISYDENLPHGL